MQEKLSSSNKEMLANEERSLEDKNKVSKLSHEKSLLEKQIESLKKRV